MKNIAFIAPPAAGKGTFSTMLKNLGYTHISTGDLLRSINPSSEVYDEVQRVFKEGGLVSTEVISTLLKEKLNSFVGPFILDGYPRSLEQTIALDEILSSTNKNLDKAIYLEVSIDTALKRVLGRLSCPKCKRDYNSLTGFNTPKVEGMCDDCNIPLEKRSDDNEESFRKRYNTYITETEPVVKYFEDKGMLVRINAERDTEEVFEKIKKELDI